MEPCRTCRRRIDALQHDKVPERTASAHQGQERVDEQHQMLQRLHPACRLHPGPWRSCSSGSQRKDNHLFHHDRQLHRTPMGGKSSAGETDGGAGGIDQKIFFSKSCPTSGARPNLTFVPFWVELNRHNTVTRYIRPRLGVNEVWV